MTSVWRIGYCRDPLTTSEAIRSTLGYGSTLGGGRWHTQSPTRLVVYAGSSRALCQLEKRVHAQGAQLKDQALMRLEIPDSCPIIDVRDHGLPDNWRASESLTQAIGVEWGESGMSLGMWVPSFIEPGENNLLINPAHPSYSQIAVVIERHPFHLDPRMFTP